MTGEVSGVVAMTTRAEGRSHADRRLPVRAVTTAKSAASVYDA